MGTVAPGSPCFVRLELLEEVAGEGAGEVEVEGVVPERMKEGGINLY